MWSHKAICQLHKRIIDARSCDEDDRPLQATVAILFLGWIHTSRRYGSGFIDPDGALKTWHDLPSLEKCEELVRITLDAAAAVDGDAQWNTAIEAAAKSAENLSFGIDIDEYREMTKKEHSARACIECATAIRALKRK